MGELDQLRDRHIAATHRVEGARHGDGPRDRLEAAPVAAPADLAVLAQRRVTQFAGGAPRPPVQPPVEHEGATDPGPYAHEDEVAGAAARAPDQLGERTQVGVVLDPDRNAQLL